ncbi:MAG TPA: transporter substrate-binding domain-containing protein [Stellaceae bacterium]|jgi:polar amino acid transport system substrate-binding protein|nr:transporter substrate-binding domain-containing protein [Stellaceae bacterium]
MAWSGAAKADATEPVIRISTSEWPPYTSQGLPGQGASSALVRHVFQRAGYRVEITFFPFKRAVALAVNDPAYVGYMTEYDDPAVRQHFAFSAVIGVSPLGFAENAQAPVTWHSLEDLRGLRIGVVNGYVNTAAFDAMMQDGQLRTQGVDLDEINLRKLVVRHLDLAVIDGNVAAYLLATTEKGAPIRMNPHMLENKNLYIAFRHDPKVDAIRLAFDKAMRGIDPVKWQQAYIAKLSAH